MSDDPLLKAAQVLQRYNDEHSAVPHAKRTIESAVRNQQFEQQRQAHMAQSHKDQTQRKVDDFHAQMRIAADRLLHERPNESLLEPLVARMMSTFAQHAKSLDEIDARSAYNVREQVAKYVHARTSWGQLTVHAGWGDKDCDLEMGALFQDIAFRFAKGRNITDPVEVRPSSEFRVDYSPQVGEPHVIKLTVRGCFWDRASWQFGQLFAPLIVWPNASDVKGCEDVTRDVMLRMADDWHNHDGPVWNARGYAFALRQYAMENTR